MKEKYYIQFLRILRNNISNWGTVKESHFLYHAFINYQNYPFIIDVSDFKSTEHQSFCYNIFYFYNSNNIDVIEKFTKNIIQRYPNQKPKLYYASFYSCNENVVKKVKSITKTRNTKKTVSNVLKFLKNITSTKTFYLCIMDMVMYNSNLNAFIIQFTKNIDRFLKLLPFNQHYIKTYDIADLIVCIKALECGLNRFLMFEHNFNIITYYEMALNTAIASILKYLLDKCSLNNYYHIPYIFTMNSEYKYALKVLFCESNHVNRYIDLLILFKHYIFPHFEDVELMDFIDEFFDHPIIRPILYNIIQKSDSFWKLYYSPFHPNSEHRIFNIIQTDFIQHSNYISKYIDNFPSPYYKNIFLKKCLFIIFQSNANESLQFLLKYNQDAIRSCLQTIQSAIHSSIELESLYSDFIQYLSLQSEIGWQSYHQCILELFYDVFQSHFINKTQQLIASRNLNVHPILSSFLFEYTSKIKRSTNECCCVSYEPPLYYKLCLSNVPHVVSYDVYIKLTNKICPYCRLDFDIHLYENTNRLE